MTDDEVNKIYYPFDDISLYDFDSKEEYENEIMRYKDNFTDAEIFPTIIFIKPPYHY